MYKKILVPLDGSRRAEAILPHVIELAQIQDSKLVLLTIVEPILRTSGLYPTLISFDAEIFSQQRETAEEYVKELASDLNGRGIETSTIIEHGSIVRSIISVAKREEADLIAIASHGRTGLSRTFYGSVAAGLLNQIDRPLLLVRAADENE